MNTNTKSKVLRSLKAVAVFVAFLVATMARSAHAQSCCLAFPQNNSALGAYITVYPGWQWGPAGQPYNGHTTPAAWFAVDPADDSGPISNDIYPAWCVDESHFLPATFDTIPGTYYIGTLISTCDPEGLANLPAHGGTPPVGPPPTVTIETWHKVNYILNHRGGYYWWNVQVAINRLVGGLAPNDPNNGGTLPTDYPPVDVTEVNAIVDAANANAAGWTLPCGGTVGVIFAIPDPTVQPPGQPLYQLIVLEVPCVCWTLTCPVSCGSVGTPYSSALETEGLTSSATYSIIAGSLPPGLYLNGSDGTIAGTPTTAGTFSFRARAIDQSSPAQSKTVVCSITIYNSALTVTGPASDGQVGVPYSSAVGASGGSGSYQFSITSGTLPPGLTLDPNTGAITGTPTSAAAWGFTVAVTDNTECGAAAETYSITITECTVSGFVYVDANNDGIKQGTELPIPGVTVTLTGTDVLGAVTATATTAADGKYEFTGLRPGTYVITESQPAGFLDGKDTIGTPGGTTANDEFSNVVLAGGVHGTDNNFGELLLSSLSGYVYVDANNDGTMDADEAPIEGVTVTLAGTDDLGGLVSASAITDANGFYAFLSLRPGSYTIVESQPGAYRDGQDTQGTPGTGTADNDVFNTIALAAGVHGVNNNFGELMPLIRIGDFVWQDANGNGVQDAGEPGIPSVTVQLLDCSGTVVNTATTDADGKYSFTVVAGGQYQVKFVILDGYTFSPTGAGTTATDSNPDPGTGIVPCATYQVSDMTIDAGLIPQGCTLTIGYYKNHPAAIQPLPVYLGTVGGAKSLKVDTQQIGVDVLSQNVYGNAWNGITKLYAQLLAAKLNILSGADQSVVVGVIAQADAFLATHNYSAWSWGGVTWDEMNAVLAWHSALDSYNNGITGPGHCGGTQEGSISGIVWRDCNADSSVDVGGPGLAGVTVTLKDASGAVVATTLTDATGAYEFNNLAAGSYTVVVTAPADYKQTSDPDATKDNKTIVTLAADDVVTDVNFGYTGTAPGVTLVKTGPATAKVGDTITYHFKVSNSGNTCLYGGLGVDDPMLGGRIFHKTPVNPGEVFEFDKTYVVQSCDLNPLVNTATAVGHPPTGAAVTAQSTWTVNLASTSPSSLSGYVYVDADNDGVKEGTESGIPGVTVTLTGKDNQGAAVSKTTTTDANGKYSFTGLRPGTYAIGETQPAYPDGKETIGTPGGTTANDLFSNIVLGAGVAGVNNNFGELVASSLSGYVYLDADNDGIKESGEAPISGVKVTLTGTDDLGNSVTKIATTDATGKYVFTGLSAGTYAIAETQPAFVDGKDTIGTPGGTTTNDRFGGIVLAAGVNGLNNNFGELTTPASLSGIVWRDCDADGCKETGEPGLAGITVTLKDAANAVVGTTTTDANGAYGFNNLPAGAYTVVVTAPANYAQTCDPDWTKDSKTAVTLTSGQAVTGLNFGYTGTAPGVSLVKTGPATAKVGDTITYHFKVTNTGNTCLYGGLGVDDPMLGGRIFHQTPVAPGESFEFDHTYSVKASDVGALVNTATATGHPPVGAAVTTKSTWTVQISPSASSSSLSGYVYLDKDNDGVKETSEAGLSGVKVTLIGKDLAGNTVSKSTTTDSTGYYKFASLPAGTYTITETQPTAYQDGKETQGTPGTGTVADNLFSNITLAAGVNGQNNNFGEVTKCSGYTTYTQGGWGCNPSGYNPGKFLADNFYSVYGWWGGCVIGTGRTAKFTSPSAIRNCLPAGGTPWVLSRSCVDSSPAGAGVFAGQVLALKLNCDFSNAGKTKWGFAGLKVASGGKCEGWTVSQVLGLCHQVLGGNTGALPSGCSVSDLNNVVDKINNNFDGGTQNLGFLCQ